MKRSRLPLPLYALPLLCLLAVPARAEAPTALTPLDSNTAGIASAATVSSPVTGITFADAPKLLPIDSRFSQAIQTIGFDVGLTCQQIEAYGWKIQPNEQTRVNNIFANTAEELARLGYAVLPQNPGSAAADITVYTASRGNGDSGQTVLFTWSAGKAGLLLLLCDARGDTAKQGFGPAPGTVAYQGNSTAQDTSGVPDNMADTSKPTDIIGEWPGTYSCAGQGPAGATLTISRVKADKSGYAVSGMFGFYPLSDKNPGPNPGMVRGSYRVAGRYDPLTHRALLEPGQWLQRPSGFTFAPLIAAFDLATMNSARVSALFQGTTGCTSFEGNYRADSAERAASKAYDDTAPAKAATAKPKKKQAVKKPAAKAAAPVAAVTAPVATPAAEVPAEAPPAESSATITSDTVTTKTAPAAATTGDVPADIPGSTAATSPKASVTAPSMAPANDAVTPPSMAAPTPAASVAATPATANPAPAAVAPAQSAPAEAPITVPPAPPAAQ